jgi:hypothetical protein
MWRAMWMAWEFSIEKDVENLWILWENDLEMVAQEGNNM